MPKYPHFVTKESLFDKNQYYTGFYMSDADVDKIVTLFPDGCSDSHISEYNIPYNGNFMVDTIYKYKPSDARDNLHSKMRQIKDYSSTLFWEWEDLLHNTYWPLWDSSLMMMCGQGRIKRNEHTKIKLLTKTPDRISKTWDAIIEKYIHPMQSALKQFEIDN